jgi:diguanylate cyclase (GGDEF)-like protein
MSGSPQVLVIDDDEAPREMLKDFCESMGYRVQVFAEPEGAKEYFKTNPEFDLIILDVFIRGKSSLWFVDYLKSTSYAEIPVIIISGAISPEYIHEALSKGVYDFVAKPFTLQQMKERMENALHYCLNIKQSKKYFIHIESLLKERTAMLEQLAFQSVKALANAIEARDPYTRGHSDRVATFSVKIAEALGFEEEALTKLNLAGLLHDVGKVGIPDLILLKPGKLTDFEYMIMKNHSNMSALIVSEVTPLKGIIPWIKHHHENFDGSGYPDKLPEGEIPFESQIIAVADNYDALSSLRPYRKKMGKSDVISYINSEFGKKFDPKLKDTALRVLGEIEEKEEIKSSISPYIEKFREAMVYIDFLTGLYWYPYLKNYIKERIATKQPFFLVYIDIEGISQINKRFGRIKGDEIIVKTAHTLQTVFFSPSVVVRAGGDDFVIYDPGDTSGINNKIAVIKEKLTKEDVKVNSKILAYPRDGKNFDELFSNLG